MNLPASNQIRFLPFVNIVFKTKLKKLEILDRISSITIPKGKMRFRRVGNDLLKTYEGTIKEDHFKLKRLITYRSSFVPEITGIITEETTETRIIVLFRLERFIQNFIIIMILFAITLIIITGMLSTLLFIFFLYVMTMIGFTSESSKSINDLQKILEAEVIEKA